MLSCSVCCGGVWCHYLSVITVCCVAGGRRGGRLCIRLADWWSGVHVQGCGQMRERGKRGSRVT